MLPFSLMDWNSHEGKVAKPCWWLFLQGLNNPYALNKYFRECWFKVRILNIIEWNGTTWATDQYFFSQNYELPSKTQVKTRCEEGDFSCPPIWLLCVCAVASVMSESLHSHGLWLARLLCSWTLQLVKLLEWLCHALL